MYEVLLLPPDTSLKVLTSEVRAFENPKPTPHVTIRDKNDEFRIDGAPLQIGDGS